MKRKDRLRENIMAAMSEGWNLRPSGWKEENDAWLCAKCGRIERRCAPIITEHDSCPGGYCLALVRADKCL